MRLWRGLIVGLCWLAAGCGGCGPGGNPDGGLPPECETRSDCDPGMVCTAEQYCAGCESSGQCLLKETCNADTLRCELREGWGTECQLNEQCQAGAWCMQGQCKDRLEVNLCPGGTKAECPQNFRCNTTNFVCEEDLGCSEVADCGAGETCNTGSHTCVPKCTVDTQAQICAAGEKCVNEICAQCATSDECGVGLICDSAGRCVSEKRCYSDRDCKVPLVCHLATGACLAKKPACVSDEGCGPEERCNVGTGKCIPRSCQPDRFEPNNASTQAFGISASRYLDLTLCNGDVDFFSLALGRGDQLGINVDADPFAEDTFSTTVRDESGRTLASGRLLTSYVAPAPATYFVSIRTNDPYQPYDVTFLLSRGTPCDDDTFEPNDQLAQAKPLNTATEVDGAICPQDQDHFSAAVPAGKGLRVSLVNYSATQGPLTLCIFEGTTSLLCSDEAAPVLSLDAASAAGKSFIFRINGNTDRTANIYTLKAEFL